MQNRFRRALALASMLLMLSGAVGCRTFRIQTDWDPEIDFAPLQNFYWLEPEQTTGANPFADNSLLRKRVREAVQTVMRDRGFIQVDTREAADFSLTFRVLLDDRLEVDNLSSSIERGLYRRRGDLGTGYSTSSVRTYQESTLILDLLAPESGELLWRGWGTGLIRTRDRDHGQERLFKGIHSILDEFPPDPES